MQDLEVELKLVVYNLCMLKNHHRICDYRTNFKKEGNITA